FLRSSGPLTVVQTRSLRDALPIFQVPPDRPLVRNSFADGPAPAAVVAQAGPALLRRVRQLYAQTEMPGLHAKAVQVHSPQRAVSERQAGGRVRPVFYQHGVVSGGAGHHGGLQ